MRIAERVIRSRRTPHTVKRLTPNQVQKMGDKIVDELGLVDGGILNITMRSYAPILNSTISPSSTIYSFPSRRAFPFSRAPFQPPQSRKAA